MNNGEQSQASRAFVRYLLADEPTDLNPENDLEYLLALIGEAERWGIQFDSDARKARWVVAHWCQEVGYQPDLSSYPAGEIVPRGQAPPTLDYQQTPPEVNP